VNPDKNGEIMFTFCLIVVYVLFNKKRLSTYWWWTSIKLGYRRYRYSR